MVIKPPHIAVSSRSRHLLPLRAALVLAAAVALSLVLATAAPAAAPTVSGVSVQSSTSVKVIFSTTVTTSAQTLSDYLISPTLTVKGAVVTDGGRSVLLTTSGQTNGRTYTVTVNGVTATDGSPMAGPGSGTFIGTTLGANTTTAAKDDFNRPSGFITTDLPIPGPWLSTDVNSKNSIALVSSPTFGGSGAFYSHVSDTDPETDNALVRYKTSGARDYYLSAYIYIPSGQGWGSQQEIGLIRFMQSMYTSHARVSAIDQSSASYYSLNVNWKSTNNAYIGPRVVATNVPFDTWHQVEMHIRDTSSSAPGEVQVWLDGKLVFADNSHYVYPAGIYYAQVGIMHLVTQGPAATTITDEVRLGTAFQLPSARYDTTVPTVTLTSPSSGTTASGVLTMAATASDNYQVQRVDFLVDGAVKNKDDFPPFSYRYDTSALSSGTHTFSARAYDTSGNKSALSSVTLTKP